MNELLQALESPGSVGSQVLFVKAQIEINRNLMKAYGNVDADRHLKVMKMYINILRTIEDKKKCNGSSLQTKDCLHCEQEFMPKTNKGKFCSTRCRTASHREMKAQVKSYSGIHGQNQ